MQNQSVPGPVDALLQMINLGNASPQPKETHTSAPTKPQPPEALPLH